MEMPQPAANWIDWLPDAVKAGKIRQGMVEIVAQFQS